MSLEKYSAEIISDKQLSQYLKAFAKSGMRKCPICNKEFYAKSSDQWGFYEGRTFFCSYKCMRKYEKNPKILEKGCNKKGQIKFSPEKQKEIIEALHKNYLLDKPISLMQMAKELKIGRTTCQKYNATMLKRYGY